MILLDTDHLSALKYRSHPRAIRLWKRIHAQPPGTVATTVIGYEEQVRGWLAAISRFPQPARQVSAYLELAALARFFAQWIIVDFDEAAAARFEELRAAKMRVGSMDLKAACVALCHDALLLSANERDYKQVPGLRFENWLD